MANSYNPFLVVCKKGGGEGEGEERRGEERRGWKRQRPRERERIGQRSQDGYKTFFVSLFICIVDDCEFSIDILCLLVSSSCLYLCM